MNAYKKAIVTIQLASQAAPQMGKKAETDRIKMRCCTACVGLIHYLGTVGLRVSSITTGWKNIKFPTRPK